MRAARAVAGISVAVVALAACRKGRLEPATQTELDAGAKAIPVCASAGAMPFESLEYYVETRGDHLSLRSDGRGEMVRSVSGFRPDVAEVGIYASCAVTSDVAALEELVNAPLEDGGAGATGGGAWAEINQRLPNRTLVTKRVRFDERRPRARDALLVLEPRRGERDGLVPEPAHPRPVAGDPVRCRREATVRTRPVRWLHRRAPLRGRRASRDGPSEDPSPRDHHSTDRREEILPLRAHLPSMRLAPHRARVVIEASGAFDPPKGCSGPPACYRHPSRRRSVPPCRTPRRSPVSRWIRSAAACRKMATLSRCSSMAGSS